ncbi:putative Hemerythrin-like metal-binding protein [Candidatus Competibacter denitrificans Run_A_D11]|uniref:Hemerythrin-like metal-binding protein n=1 Tax=Candidatus Competibacter denitrificans Run_A_D11 TaxID=1400863 RepID=W6MCJ2_9GAMM|nr:bacteriohemerythrin [Candidatus Competibacter denitrificans]CDI04065.1 putative Hemerythrin-like metal-binding protein [Candidatus Competibacter denitrificans Run_A_D11]
MADKDYIPWSEDLSVGLEEIDEQHKILINLINRLFNEAILKRADKALISDILDELIQYTIVHFAVEESLFRIFDYPDSEAHQEHHNQLKNEVVNFRKKFQDDTPIDIELMSFLKKWITLHIMKDDRKYTPFFLEKGFKAKWTKQQSWMGKIWSSFKG